MTGSEHTPNTTRRLRLSWGGATHQGRVRTANQDALFADRGLFVVADGMGGHQGGEVAAQIAVRTMSGLTHASMDDFVDAVKACNTAVFEHAVDNPELKGMGTTLTAIAVLGDGKPPRLGLVNVGDSRTYRMRDGELEQLTDDHSYVAELVRRGQLKEGDSHTHPYRNMLTRAVGVADDVDVDTWEIDPVADDRYVLCSDGLVNELTDLEIRQAMLSASTPTDLARTLIERANIAGGRDNITVVVVFVQVDEIPVDDATTEVAAAAAAVETTILPVVDPLETGVVLNTGDPLFDDPVDDADLPVVQTVTDPLAAFELPELDGDDQLPWLSGAARPPAAEPEFSYEPITPAPVAIQPAATAQHAIFDAEIDTTVTAPVPFADPVAAASSRAANGSGWTSPVAITWRTLAVVVVGIIALVGAVAAIGTYARGTYHVAFAGDEVVIYQGRSGGVLWFDPTLEEGSGIFRSQLPEASAAAVAGVVEVSSLEAARDFVDQIRPVASGS